MGDRAHAWGGPGGPLCLPSKHAHGWTRRHRGTVGFTLHQLRLKEGWGDSERAYQPDRSPGVPELQLSPGDCALHISWSPEEAEWTQAGISSRERSLSSKAQSLRGSWL